MLSDPVIILLAVLCLVIALALVFSAPGRAQPRLRTKEVVLVGGVGGPRLKLVVEEARTVREQRIGLMFRSAVPQGTGMLFRWARPLRAAVWMRNVRVPLDLVFLSSQGEVLSVVRRRPGGWAMSGYAVRSAGLLELSGGTCARLGVGPGWRLMQATGRDGEALVGLQWAYGAPGWVAGPVPVSRMDQVRGCMVSALRAARDWFALRLWR